MSSNTSHNFLTLDDSLPDINNTFARIRQRNQAFQAPFSERRLILMTGDLFFLIAAAVVAVLLRDWISNLNFRSSMSTENWYWLIIWFAIWIGCAKLSDLYDIPTSNSRALTGFRVFFTGWLALIIFVPVSLLLRNPTSSLIALYSMVFALPLIIVWRLLYIKISKMTSFNYRVLIIGTGKKARSMMDLLEEKAGINYNVMGCIGVQPTLPKSDTGNLSILGSTSDLPRIISEQRIHEIVIATENGIDQDLFQYLVQCQANGIRLIFMPDLFGRLQRKVPIENIDEHWAAHALLDRAIFKRIQLAAKRLIDILLLIVGLPLFGLLLPLLALAIRLDSPGPVFYRQVRSGRAGKPFSILKFRTMVSDAEADGKPQWAQKNDDRITRVGRFMRKSRLDEIPQMINVLQGDMSFVGPRPERPEFVQQLRNQVPYYDTRMMVKPGLTGWAQVHYRYASSTDDAFIKLEYDLYYITHWSFWVDLYVLFRTVSVVVKLGGS